MKILLFIALLSSTAAAQHTTLPTNVDMTLLTPLETVLESPETYLALPVTVEGKVVAVCKNRGCWAEIATEKNQKLRLKVRDGNYTIPLSARGKTAYATGQLTALQLSKQQAILYLEHMAQDAGKAFDRNSVKAGITIYNLRPSALKFVDN